MKWSINKFSMFNVMLFIEFLMLCKLFLRVKKLNERGVPAHLLQKLDSDLTSNPVKCIIITRRISITRRIIIHATLGKT